MTETTSAELPALSADDDGGECSAEQHADRHEHAQQHDDSAAVRAESDHVGSVGAVSQPHGADPAPARGTGITERREAIEAALERHYADWPDTAVTSEHEAASYVVEEVLREHGVDAARCRADLDRLRAELATAEAALGLERRRVDEARQAGARALVLLKVDGVPQHERGEKYETQQPKQHRTPERDPFLLLGTSELGEGCGRPIQHEDAGHQECRVDGGGQPEVLTPQQRDDAFFKDGEHHLRGGSDDDDDDGRLAIVAGLLSLGDLPCMADLKPKRETKNGDHLSKHHRNVTAHHPIVAGLGYTGARCLAELSAGAEEVQG